MPGGRAALSGPKKGARGATERAEFSRLLWRTEIGRVDPGRLVLVDEMGTHTSSLAPPYSYAPIGERAFFGVPRTAARTPPWWRASTPRERDRPWPRKGDHQGGLRSPRRGALPGRRPATGSARGDGRPRSPQAKEGERTDRGAGCCELPYPPPYSPDLNPVEEAFSKVERMLRKKIGARGKEAPMEAMGRASGAVSSEDARGFFARCGYRAPPAQQP
jgi:hypothetical protein